MRDLASSQLTETSATKLVDTSPEVLDACLARHLFDGRLTVRRNAGLLLKVGPPLNVRQAGRMALALRDSDSVVRARILATWAKADISPKDAMRACVAGLSDAKDEVQDTAVDGALHLLDRHKGAGAEMLIVSTADPRPYVRFAANDILRRAGLHVLDPLLGMLSHSDGVVRRNVRQLLRQLGRPAADALVDLLRDEDAQGDATIVLASMDEWARDLRDDIRALRKEGPLIRVCAEEVLKAWKKAAEQKLNQPLAFNLQKYYQAPLKAGEVQGAIEGIEPLRLLFNLRDGRPVVRLNTLRLLAALSITADERERVFAASAPLMRDGEASVRMEAIHLWSVHQGALAPLLDAGEDKDDEVRAVALKALDKVAKSRCGELLAALEGGHADHYHLIADVLRSAGASVWPQLLDALRLSTHPIVREFCARVLGGASKASKEHVAALAESLSDSHEAVRFRAIWALNQLQVTEPEILRRLMQVELSEPVRHVKRAAHKAVKKLVALAEEKARQAEPEPAPEFTDSVLKPEAAAVEVARLKPAQVARMFNDGREQVRENVAAGASVVDVGSDAGQALFRGLRDASPRVRQASALSIARNRLDADVAIPALLDALVGAEPPVDEVLVGAVAMYGEDAHGPLIATLEERSYRVARTTGKVAAAFDDKLAQRLGLCLKHDRTLTVRRNAADVLGMMGANAGTQGIEDLLAALDDPTPSLKLQVIGALAVVAPPSEEVMERLRKALSFERRASIHRAVDRAIRTITSRA